MGITVVNWIGKFCYLLFLADAASDLASLNIWPNLLKQHFLSSRDLKPENILLDCQVYSQIVLPAFWL